jgi:ATP-dependent RNA helicase DDX31/DBP7
LVGLSLNDPILLKATGPNPEQKAAEHDDSNDPLSKSESTTFSAPTQLSQCYVLTPPKLRLVSLIALLRRITDSKQKKPAEKVLVFMSCTTSVDFHFEAIGATSASGAKEKGPADPEAEESEPSKLVKQSQFLPGVKIFRLHGSLDLQTRLASLNAFANSDTKSQGSSILFCTSLAGRGLDVPFVSHVIQYDLPTEGGVTEYLHRVGRTARAGQAGEAWSFLLPSEAGWVDWCETQQSENSAAPPKLKEVGVQKLLNDGFGGKTQKDWEVRATDTQMIIERWVVGNEEVSCWTCHKKEPRLRSDEIDTFDLLFLCVGDDDSEPELGIDGFQLAYPSVRHAPIAGEALLPRQESALGALGQGVWTARAAQEDHDGVWAAAAAPARRQVHRPARPQHLSQELGQQSARQD